jgi:hypothetical protein
MSTAFGGTHGRINGISILMHDVLVTPAMNKLGRHYRTAGIIRGKGREETKT